MCEVDNQRPGRITIYTSDGIVTSAATAYTEKGKVFVAKTSRNNGQLEWGPGQVQVLSSSGPELIGVATQNIFSLWDSG